MPSIDLGRLVTESLSKFGSGESQGEDNQKQVSLDDALDSAFAKVLSEDQNSDNNEAFKKGVSDTVKTGKLWMDKARSWMTGKPSEDEKQAAKGGESGYMGNLAHKAAASGSEEAKKKANEMASHAGGREEGKSLASKAGSAIAKGAHGAVEYAKEHPGRVAGGAALLGAGAVAGRALYNRMKKGKK